MNAGLEAERWGTAHASIVPYQTFETSDGHMTVGCGNDPAFRELCQRMGLEGLAKSDKFSTNERRVVNRDELLDVLSDLFRTKTTEEWNVAFEGVSFPYGSVNNLGQVFSDPQVVHNGLRRTVHHDSLGEVGQVGPAVRFSGSENDIRSPPPILGAHTDTVLKGVLGIGVEELEELREKGVIR